VRRYRYEATADYGGPKLDESSVPVRAAHLSLDRRRLYVVLSEMKPGFVHHLRFSPGLLSDTLLPLWSPEAWYTLNVVPALGAEHRVEPAEPRLPATPNRPCFAVGCDGWHSLFDGASLQGWSERGREGPPQGWSVVDGAVVRTGEGGDLQTTDEDYGDFEFVFDWATPPGGNSGVRFRVGPGADAAALTGPEYQLLDVAGHPDGGDPFTAAGACYGLVAPSYDATAFVGAWNRSGLIVRGDEVQHWLNGRKVAHYRVGAGDWAERVSRSKFKDRPLYGTLDVGRLVLQSHGAAVRFRNLFVRRLQHRLGC
jgi:hypothetical protein